MKSSNDGTRSLTSAKFLLTSEGPEQVQSQGLQSAARFHNEDNLSFTKRPMTAREWGLEPCFLYKLRKISHPAFIPKRFGLQRPLSFRGEARPFNLSMHKGKHCTSPKGELTWCISSSTNCRSTPVPPRCAPFGLPRLQRAGWCLGLSWWGDLVGAIFHYHLGVSMRWWGRWWTIAQTYSKCPRVERVRRIGKPFGTSASEMCLTIS